MITCKFESGADASLRHVVVNCVMIRGNKVFLVKRAPHISNPDMWGMPGGFLDRDEDAKEAIKREVYEETGYESEVEYLFRLIDNPNRPKEDRQNVCFVYVVKAGDKTGGIDNEQSEVKWFDLDELPSKDEFAFDHRETLELFKKHLKNPMKLPLL